MASHSDILVSLMATEHTPKMYKDKKESLRSDHGG